VCGQAFKNETDACARARADRMRIYYCQEKSLTDKCPSQKSTIYFIQIVSEHTHIPARAYCDGRQHHRLQSAAPCAHYLPSPYTCRRLTSDTRDRAAQILVPGGRRQTNACGQGPQTPVPPVCSPWVDAKKGVLHHRPRPANSPVCVVERVQLRRRFREVQAQPRVPV
jgi:hypothetical protein